jgi:diguanylate cyclase (GGDEF)-like protein
VGKAVAASEVRTIEDRSGVKKLSSAARIYITVVLLAGLAVLAWGVTSLPSGGQEWIAFGILSVCGAFTQLFPVTTPRNQAYYVTLVFLFAGLLLLPPLYLVILVIVVFIPEWIKLKLSWHVQLFNVASFLVDAFIARTIYIGFNQGAEPLLGYAAGLIGAVIAAAVFTILNHFLLAVVLRLARGHTWRETRLFQRETLLIDGTLSCMGIITALLWQVNPWLVVLSGAPLFLIYKALNAPNLEEQARTDSKTGLYNATHFQGLLRDELKRAERFERPLAVIMADMDLLRNINNTYGHLAGDVVLKGVADIIRSELREYDVAARFGGEEYAVLLPETDTDQALVTAERLRKRVEEARFKVTTSIQPIQATLSLGVATFPLHGGEPNELIHQADLAVYYAKLRGRNQSCACSAESMALAGLGVSVPDLEAHLSELGNSSRDDYGSPMPPPTAPRESSDPMMTGAGGAPDEASADSAEASQATSETAGQPDETADSPRPSRANRRQRASDLTWPVALLVAGVCVSSVALWALYMPWKAGLDWLGLAGVAAVIVVSQRQAIDIYGRGKISTSAILLLAGAIMFGPPGALLLATLVPITQWIQRRGILYRSLMDLGTITLSTVAASIVYAEVSVRLPWSQQALLLLPASLAALCYYLLNHGLLSLAMGLSEKTSPYQIWNERFRWLFVYYLMYGVLGLAVALAYEAIGLYGIIAFFVPLLMMRYVTKQYIDRTEENVAKLTKANEELVLANDEVVRTMQQLQTTYDAIILALSAALDSRDSETEGHSQRVVQYAELIAQRLGLPEKEMSGLLKGAMLHDVGKIGVPDAILRKPGPLTATEWATMRTHPKQGYRMLEHIDFLKDALPIVRFHHERFDGAGYPDGLQGQDIPLGARIFAIADSFDAMISRRPYRQGCSCEVAREEIRRCSGTQFDPTIVETFLQIDVAELVQLSGQATESASETVRASSVGKMTSVPNAMLAS